MQIQNEDIGEKYINSLKQLKNLNKALIKENNKEIIDVDTNITTDDKENQIKIENYIKLCAEKTVELENIQLKNTNELKFLKDTICLKEKIINDLKNNIKEINNNHKQTTLSFKNDFEEFNSRSLNITMDNKNLNILISELENNNNEINFK